MLLESTKISSQRKKSEERNIFVKNTFFTAVLSDCAGYSVHYKLSLKIKRNQKAFKGNSFLEELVNIGSNFGGLSYQRKSSENHSWPTIEKFVFMKILNLINNLKIWKQ